MNSRKQNKLILWGAIGLGAVAFLSQTKPGQQAVNKVEDMLLPRGIRNNNPGNLRDSSSQWNGKIGVDKDKFVQFSDMDLGIRASLLNIISAVKKHKCDTVRKLVYRWAPPSDNNNSAAYVAAVSKSASISADTKIDTTDTYTLARIAVAMFEHENGKQPTSSAGIDSVRVQGVIKKYAIS